MKTRLLLYCTKGKPYLFNRIIKGKSVGYYTDIVPYDIEDEYLCGKIVSECECEVEEIIYDPLYNEYHSYGYPTYNKKGKLMDIDWHISSNELLKKSCLVYKELDDYLKKDNGYAIHLKNIKAFEKPFRIEYVKDIEMNALTKAPQNMCWVWYKGQKYVLVSIRPEWLCKILNGEKTIEVRRKILKVLEELMR